MRKIKECLTNSFIKKSKKIRNHCFSTILLVILLSIQSINAFSNNPNTKILDDNDKINKLSFSKINELSYTIDNTFKKTVKIKIFDSLSKDRTFVVLPDKSITIFYQNHLLSRNLINSTIISVYYDLECYNKDLQIINDLAAQRLKDEQSRQELNMYLRMAGDWLKTLDSKIMKGVGKTFVGIADFSDILHAYENGGFSPELIKTIIEGLYNVYKDENKAVEAIDNNLKALYKYRNSALEINTKDLEDAVFYLYQSIGETLVDNYKMNYSETIAPVIDFDDDEILNLYDMCPRIAGYEKYHGCTKKDYKEIMRKDRNKIIKFFWMDLGFSYSSYGKVTLYPSDFKTKLEKSTFYLNTTVPILKHKYSNKYYGAFGIEANYLVGNLVTPKVKITTTDTKTGKVKDEVTDRLKVIDHSIYAGLSYNFVIRSNNGGTMIQPEFGTLLYSSQIDNAYKLNKYYAGLTLRFDVSNGGWFFGAKYQQNPNYSMDFYSYSFILPNHNWNYYLGLYFRF